MSAYSMYFDFQDAGGGELYVLGVDPSIISAPNTVDSVLDAKAGTMWASPPPETNMEEYTKLLATAFGPLIELLVQRRVQLAHRLRFYALNWP